MELFKKPSWGALMHQLRLFKMGCLEVTVCAMMCSSPAMANWTANVGYHNPPGAALGLNFLYLGADIGVEIGLGWVQLDASDSNAESNAGAGTSDPDERENLSLNLAGDINFKYFFNQGAVKPFLQAGFGLGVGTRIGEDSSAGAGVDGGFLGAGIFAGSPNLHIYGSFNAHSSNNTFLQLGVGTDI